MRRKAVILVIGFLNVFFLFSQVDDTFSDSFTAVCNESMNLNTTDTSNDVKNHATVSIENDSIQIKDVISNQCCPMFSLEISEIVNDTLYVTFSDTSSQFCDCICDYTITLNVGKYDANCRIINYNGTILIVYRPLLEKGKSWTTVYDCYLSVDSSYTINKVEVTDDNFIEGKFYPVDSNSTFYLKEENGKVYWYESRGGDIDSSLVYDFTVDKGDTLHNIGYHTEHYSLIVDSVNYPAYNNKDRRKTLYLSGGNRTTWIEGIGDVRSPLDYWLPFPPNNCLRDFTCCTINGELLYRNPGYQNCEEKCSVPVSDFIYYTLESYPVKILLQSTAMFADSIVWKAISNESFKDTIIGTGETIVINDPYALLVTFMDCLYPPGCPNTFVVTQVVTNSCGIDSISKIVPIEWYVSDNQIIDDSFRCFPNPTEGYIHVQGIEFNKGTTFMLLNAIGQKVQQGNLESNIQLNVPNGIYLLFIVHGDRVLHQEKIIVGLLK